MKLITPSLQVEFIPFGTKLKPIMTPWYLPKDCHFKLENIFWRSPNNQYQNISKNSLGSWAIARLCHIFGTSLLEALNIELSEEGAYIGLQDGGAFYAEGHIISTHNQEVMAHLYLEGFPDYINFCLLDCSDQLKPDSLMLELSNWIWEQAWEIAICHLQIKDPEQNQKAFHYGWDGQQYYTN